jgi:hypothetical protein
VITFLSDTTRSAQDRIVRAQARDDAARILEMIAAELRMAGSGMPLGQRDFSMADSTLGDASLPILTSSDEHSITYRTATTGKTLILTSDFTPSSSSRSFSLLSSTGLSWGDVIYISNITRGGTAGMQAAILSASGNNVTVDRNFTASANATFEAGSIVHKVSTITYESNELDSGIVRTEGAASSVFADHATLTFKYLNEAGIALALPLTSGNIANNLASVQITVNLESRRRLRDGKKYYATAKQAVALRNIIVTR